MTDETKNTSRVTGNEDVVVGGQRGRRSEYGILADGRRRDPG